MRLIQTMNAQEARDAGIPLPEGAVGCRLYFGTPGPIGTTPDTETQQRDAGAELALEAEARKFELEWAISKAARAFPRFTSDEVWNLLREIDVTELEHPNAMGAAFLQASRAGIIENTGRVRKSARAVAHRRAVALWRSLVFGRP